MENYQKVIARTGVISNYFMRPTYLIVIIILSIGCHKISSTKRHEFRLIDEDSLVLGVVTCRLPFDFDTSYQWINSSDCICCDAVMYRCHSRKFDVIAESGFLPDSHLDSGFYFTISHFTTISCDTSREYYHNRLHVTSDDKKRRFEQFIKELEKSGGARVTFDTAIIINKNLYDVFCFTEKNYYKVLENDSSVINTVVFNTLSAHTKYKGRYIGFSIQSNIQPRDSFCQIAMEIMKSVKIE
ncbi:MAG: hypothetical protein ABJC12_13275 [Saprospiraceae bacterium]